MPVLNSSLGVFRCVRSTCIEGSLVMSHKCYDVADKLRAVTAAERKSKEAAAQEFKVDVHVQRIREWCSQKEKLTV